MQHEDVGSSRSGSNTLAPSHGFSPTEWAVLWGLYSSQDPHQQESLCAELLTLPAEHINRYLLQYVYLAVARPSGPLERAVTQLCGRSFNIAVQVSWLLLALLQDQPGNRHVRLFKDACERAALTGSWMSPFEQAANQLDEQQQQQQEEEDLFQQQQQQQQQQDGGCGDQAVSTPSQCRSEPASIPAAAAGAAGPDLAASSPAVPACPHGSGSGSGSPAGGPAAVNNNSSSSSSRSSSLDLLLAHKASSLDAAHRFRNSLDLELMRHKSSQDLLLHNSSSSNTAAAAGGGSSRPTSAAAAAAGKKGVTTSSSQQVQQQQQLGQHGLPAVKTLLAVSGTPASSSSSSSVQQQQTQRTPSPAGTAVAGQSHLYSSSSSSGDSGGRVVGWGAAPGSAAAQQYSSFSAYLAARRQELVGALGPGEGVSGLIEASHSVAAGSVPEGIGWLVTHEEDLSDFLSMSVLLSQPPSCPAQAAARDAYLATLDFVEALCETSSSLTRFPPADRQRVLVQCLARISSEVEGAAAQGVGVRWPIRGCSARVLRLLPDEAAIMNSRDKAPFLLLLETQAEEEPPLQQQQQTASTPEAAAAAATTASSPAAEVHTSSSQQQQQQQSPRRSTSPHKVSPLRRGSTHTGQEQQQAPRPAAAAPAAATTATPGDSSKPQDSQAASGSAQAADRQQQQAVQQPASAKQQQHSEEVAEPLLLQRSCPSLLELQMQEAAALLRGEPSTTTSSSNSSSKLVRVQIRVQELPLSGPTGQVLGAAAQRDSSSRGQHNQGSSHNAGPTSRSSPSSALGPFSPNTQRRALMSGQQQQQQQLSQWQQQQRDEEWGSDNDDDASEPFLFGEVPSRLDSSCLNAPSSSSHSTPASAAAAVAAAGSSSGGAVVRVSIEVLPAGPSVPQLALPAAPGRWQQRRRLPSMEAIDIIAGKLGRSALPAPADIGPPLHPGSASAASSRRASSELDAAAAVDLPPTAAIAAAASSGSTGSSGGGSSSGTTHMPAVLEGVPAATAAAGAADSGSSDAKPEAGGSRPPKAAAAAVVATAAADGWQHVRAPPPPADSAQQDSSSNELHQSSSNSRGRRSSWSGGQQQQPPGSPMGLWGRLFNSLGSRQQPQPQQQQVPSSPQGHRGQQYSPQEAAAAAAEQAKRAAAVFGERWSKVCARTAAASPYGREPGWGLAGAIVKSGDDCRQELLALQLIRELQDIWTAAGLPLWVRPFEVLVTSADTALIELIPDAISIHTIKARARRSSSSGGATPAAAAAARTPTRSSSMQQQRQQQQQRPAPRVRHSYSGGGSSSGAAAAPPREQQQQQQQPSSPGLSMSATGSGGAAANLADFFFARWQKGTPECLAAQRRFVESLAGYSLATYLLQVKDRHNGNIMMDASGRLIHIDYGFMLSNTPGGGWVRFEAAPLKLTRELLEVMDSDSEGQPSALFDYFKVLCIQGFLAARKERHRLVGLVRIMADCTSLACPSGSSSNTPSAAAAGGTARVSDSSNSSSKRGARRSSSSGGQQQGGAGLPPPASSPSAAAGSAAVVAGGVGVGSGPPAGAVGSASWPCFRAGGDRVVSALEARFVPGMAESAVVSHVLWLISTSLDAWSTRTYDYYQLVLNGIL